jgi:poly(3-hydroxyalkanoate) synthetase
VLTRVDWSPKLWHDRKKSSVKLPKFEYSVFSVSHFVCQNAFVPHLITFSFLKGHDTTASAMSFLLYNVAKHKDVQEKIFAEIQDQIVDLKKITIM